MTQWRQVVDVRRWSAADTLFVLILIAAFVVGLLLVAIPGKWDKAVVLKICRDGTPILRLTDGSVWARRSAFRAYRVDNVATVCER